MQCCGSEAFWSDPDSNLFLKSLVPEVGGQAGLKFGRGEGDIRTVRERKRDMFGLGIAIFFSSEVEHLLHQYSVGPL